MSIILNIPIRVVSEANSRGSWRYAWTRKKQHQQAVAMHMAVVRSKLAKMKAPYIVTLTRIGKRTLDDDNLRGAFKFARDQVARGLGIDDGSALIDWRYAQECGKVYAIRISIESLGVAAA